VFFTSLRKGCTLVLSYILFPKVITAQHLLGGVLIAGGILLNDKVSLVLSCVSDDSGHSTHPYRLKPTHTNSTV
jgi:hypothetical protein